MAPSLRDICSIADLRPTFTGRFRAHDTQSISFAGQVYSCAPSGSNNVGPLLHVGRILTRSIVQFWQFVEKSILEVLTCPSVNLFWLTLVFLGLCHVVSL